MLQTIPKYLRAFLIFPFIVMICLSSRAEIKLPSIINSNMVLQQKSEVPLWGMAERNAKVTITTSWNRKRYSFKADDTGAWRHNIETPAAGGPYEITISDGQKITLDNVLIGEVWICSGQSNMEMPMKGFNNQPILRSNEILLGAENSNIRLFRLEKNGSRKELADCEGTWEISSAKAAKEFSAVGYQFAALLQRELKVPVGIIQTAWGGTMIEAWMSKNSLKDFPEVVVLPETASAAIEKSEPTVLFNAMIRPLIGYGIKGVIWYQGEQNRANPAGYARLMPAMVKEWRHLWGQGEWPFYYVQIAPHVYRDSRELIPFLREAQAKGMQTIPNSGMAVSLDVGDEKTVHPADKTKISERLAFWALAKTYGREGIAYAGPVYKAMQVQGSTVNLTFDHAPNGLTSFGKELTLFEVAGEDKVFYPATAKITRQGIAVKSDKVSKPLAVRYAFKDWLVGELFNTEGLPASSFRTDEWNFGNEEHAFK